MWFWEKESVEYEVFKKYEPALLTIGVNFADAEVQDALEGCSKDLEDALRSAIEYALWLSEHEKEIFPNALLIRALQDNWKPKAWRDEYLEREMFSSPGQRWWNASEKMWGRDVRNQLVVDVFFDGGGEFIKFSNGKEIRVKTAWVLGWERFQYRSPFGVMSKDTEYVELVVVQKLENALSAKIEAYFAGSIDSPPDVLENGRK